MATIDALHGRNAEERQELRIDDSDDGGESLQIDPKMLEQVLAAVE